jgi:glycosyltransferase involved in cell wall biosynthesis
VNSKHKVVFITIVPSPYQRDLFEALAARNDVDLSVYYLEASSPDSPWPEKPLRPFERIMPGFWVSLGGVRGHLNWRLPSFSQGDITVLSSFTSLTGQWLMRRSLRGRRWLFWGERLRQNSGLRAFMQRKLIVPISNASGIVGIGRAAEEDYHGRFPHLPHFNIPYHCDLSALFSIRPRCAPSGPITFFFCGQMIWRKGIDLLLLAFNQLIMDGFDARLLLVGREAELPNYLEMVSPVSRAQIHYEGFKAPEHLPKYFEKSDVLVLPSRHEGWGVVVNQALAAGLAIITSDAVGAGLDFVDNGVNGMRIEAGDVQALYSAMKVFISNPTLAAQWGHRSREKARKLTPAAGSEKWVQVFDSLHEHRKQTRVPVRHRMMV